MLRRTEVERASSVSPDRKTTTALHEERPEPPSRRFRISSVSVRDQAAIVRKVTQGTLCPTVHLVAQGGAEWSSVKRCFSGKLLIVKTQQLHAISRVPR